MTSSILEVTIHSALAIKALEVPALRLWYYLRAMDNRGSGRIDIVIDDIKSRFNISKATLYRYLNNKHLFRNYINNKGLLTIYLVSLPKVCKALDVYQLGSIGYGNANDCLIEQAVGIQAQSLQQQSFYLANRANRVTSTEINNPKFYKKELKLKPSYNPSAARHPIVNPINCFFDANGNVIPPSVISPGVNGDYMPIAQAHKMDTPAGVRPAVIIKNGHPYHYLQANSC